MEGGPEVEGAPGGATDTVIVASDFRSASSNSCLFTPHLSAACSFHFLFFLRSSNTLTVAPAFVPPSWKRVSYPETPLD